MDDDYAKAQARVGAVIAGKYRLRRVLGVGGVGAVFAAVHAFTGKHVAVKILDPSIAGIAGYTQRFLREARAAADIGHPAIVDVLDAGQETDGALYLVLELLEGRNMGEAIEAGDMSLDEIIEAGAQVCEALAAAHDRKIVHRDIKPENIYLCRDETGALYVKVLDFGIAKKRRREGEDLWATKAGQVMGTPYYMSPEQAAGESDVDGRSDVWSAGASLYHALAGHPPFQENTYNLLIARLIGGPPPKPIRELRPDIPGWLGNVVDGALKHDVTERWQSAAQMARGLRLRGEVPIGLDWEHNEDLTVQGGLHYDADIAESLPPPGALGSFDPAAEGRKRLSQQPTPAPVDHEALTQTLAATPLAHASGLDKPAPTPQAWEQPGAPTKERRLRSGFVAGAITGGVIALLVLGVTAVMYLGPFDDEERVNVRTPLPDPPAPPPAPAPALGEADGAGAIGAVVTIAGEHLGGVERVTVGGVEQPFEITGDEALRVGPLVATTPLGAHPVVATRGELEGTIPLTVARVVISEVDARRPDGAPFVEIETGAPGVSLEGFAVLAFDGRDDALYAAAPLGATDGDGRLLVELPLRDGPAAVVVVRGPIPPLGSPPTAEALDAVVHARAPRADDDPELLELLSEGAARVQLAGDSRSRSWSRCGDAVRDGRAFRAAPPTPGAANACD